VILAFLCATESKVFSGTKFRSYKYLILVLKNEEIKFNQTERPIPFHFNLRNSEQPSRLRLRLRLRPPTLSLPLSFQPQLWSMDKLCRRITITTRHITVLLNYVEASHP